MAECLAECLPEIDRVLEECLTVPQLRLHLPVGTPAVVVEAVKESLRQRASNTLKEAEQRAIDIWKEDREVARRLAEQAARRRDRTQTLLTTPVVTPIVTSGAPPDPPKERRMVLLNNKM